MSGHKREPFELPDTTDLESVNAAEIAVIRLVAQGQLRAREGLHISRMLEHRRRAIGDETLEQTMKRLEEQGRKARGQKP